MDTVSAIRGNQGRPPLPVGDRIYFMKQSSVTSTGGKFNHTEPLKFQFKLEGNQGVPLIDAYIGVDFSIVYKVTLQIMPRVGGKTMDGKAELYCRVAGSGKDPSQGSKLVPRDFLISPEGLTAPPG